MLSKRTKTKVVGEHAMHEKDTGSASVQIAILSRQIDELTDHLKKHSKDNHSRRGLLKMVSQRRKLLGYMKRRQPEKYEKLIKKLDLKK
ncbi:MAG: 30S ribosomal protein S15 [Candidatus Liptonbacteria bacterium]|nr:30S ribosomal protein S15 [Candidatus Liptonbacteria bacterium]